MIHADFESILVLENNGKENLDEPYTNKYQNHVSCNFCYKLVSADDPFSKLFNSYLSQDAIHNFITSKVEESKHCSHVINKHF